MDVDPFCLSSSFSDAESVSSSSSSAEAGEREGGSVVESREKSSIDAGSEGEVMSGEPCSEGANVALLSSDSALVVVLKDRKVGKLGVDLDWKPVGTGIRLADWPVPLLCGGMVFVARCRYDRRVN